MTETAVGGCPTQIAAADFYDAGRVKGSFRWTTAQVRRLRLTYETEAVQHNIPIEAAKFVKPSAPAH